MSNKRSLETVSFPSSQTISRQANEVLGKKNSLSSEKKRVRTQLAKKALSAAEVGLEVRYRDVCENLKQVAEFEQSVEATKEALAERYKEHGLEKRHFRLVEASTEDGQVFHTVMLATRLGMDLGNQKAKHDSRRSFTSIIDDTSHIISVNGEPKDTRNLSPEAYLSFYETELKRGRGHMIDPTTKHEYRFVWLTALPIHKYQDGWSDNFIQRPFYVYTAGAMADYGYWDLNPEVGSERKVETGIDPNYDGRGAFFRPAVVLPSPQMY